jgi:hypothetical protein
MSEKDKAEPSKSVMGNLPATRPTRMARRRDGDPVTRAEEAPAKPRASTKPRPKAAAKSPAKTKTKAKAKAKATEGTTRPAAKPKAAAGEKASKPRAVRSGSPSLTAAKKKSARTPRRPPASDPPKGAELVTTAVQATGELAKIGLTLGRQAVKRAAKRLPKP